MHRYEIRINEMTVQCGMMQFSKATESQRNNNIVKRSVNNTRNDDDDDAPLFACMFSIT